MTQPVSYEPRTLNAVSAMLNDGTPESTQAISEWVTPLLLEGGEVFINWPAQVYIQNGSNSLTIAPGYYVYLRNDEFHAISKDAFELCFQVSDGV